MPTKQPPGPDFLAEVGALLGVQAVGKTGGKTQGKAKINRGDDGAAEESPDPTGASGSPLPTLDSLIALTQRQLQEASRKLGLTAVSKLKKDSLAKMVLDAWRNLVDAPADAPADAGTPEAIGSGQLAGPRLVPDGDEGAAVVADVDPDDHSALSHKFEVGQPSRVDSEETLQISKQSAKEIPWGYGRDRVTAMAVDPDRLFMYWEVLDDSVAHARDKLGRGGPGAWLNLRVYDTTGRIFDGTNAHGTVDHRVERGDRQWFFPIGKPTSDVIVEIGMKSDEGFFVKIARSGRVEFPRREPAAAVEVEPEWLTVRLATGQVERSQGRVPGRPPRSQLAPGVGWANAANQSDPLPAPTGVLRHVPWEDALHFGAATTERHQWEEVHADGSVVAHRQYRWEGPAAITSWEAGPFPYPVETPDAVRETHHGRTRLFRTRGRTHVVHGPWQVVIRGLGAQQTRSVLSRWEVYRSWSQAAGHEAEFWQGSSSSPGGASEMMAGASERRWSGSSELNFAGSSELYFLQASELRLGGASELSYGGASEWVMRGASERRFLGASEARLAGGASESRLGGSSASLVRPAIAESAAPRTGASLYPPPPGQAMVEPDPASSAPTTDRDETSRKGS